MNEEPATNLLDDIVRKDNISGRLFNKTFSNLETDEVNFEKVNGIRAGEIIYENDASASINGNIVFEMPVEAENVVSTVKQRSSFPASSGAHAEDEMISDEEIHFPANVTVDFINGINFTEFARSLCLVDAMCYIPGKVVLNGNISATTAETFNLNGLKFPNEYLFDDNDTHSNITGRKTFTNTLATNDANLQGTIDGVVPQNIVTLSTDQHIPAKLTFNTLQVFKLLTVTGSILDEDGNTFSQHPTLMHSNILKANVNFRDIEIEGNVVVDSNFNGAPFNDTLEDIVYQDTSDVAISAMKNFQKPVTVQDQLIITTDSINSVNLKSLVTKNTRQHLKLNRLNGDVTIRNLLVLGNYDGKDITTFEDELVKLTGDQYIASTLIFMDELDVNNLNVKKLNDIPHEEFYYTTGVNNIRTNMEFEDVEVTKLAVKKNVIGVSSDNGVLDSLDKKYLSITKNQNIDDDYFISLSNVGNISTDTLNGNSSIFSSPGRFSSVIEEYLNQDTLQVDDLYFEKSVKVNIINNKTTSNLLYAQLRNSKVAQSNLSIEGNVYFDDLDIVLFGSTNWSTVVGDFIFRNNSNFNVKGVKTFTDEFTIEKLIQTEKLNSILLENILTKQGNQELKGDILIKGNVTFKDLTVEDDQNVFSTLLVRNGTFFVEGDMLFSRLPHIQNLTFDGLINGRSLESEIRRTVFTDKITEADMTVVFEGPVNVLGNVHVKELINNISLSEALTNIVLIGEDSSILNTAVFTHPVLINESLTIEYNLITQKLFGFVLDEWMDRAIPLNRGYLSGNYSFEEVTVKDALVTERINNISTKNIVPLKSNQSIDELHFVEAHIIRDITAVDTVNGVNLSEEFKNTFLVDGDQAIESMVFENNVLIRKNLNTPLLNNKPTARIVTTDSDQELTANYDFKTKVTAQRDLKVHGLLNEINTTKWKDNLLKVSGANRQQINRAFDVARNVTFQDDVDGDGLVAGLDLVELAEKIDEIKKNKFEVDRGVIDDYNNICTDIKYLSGMTESQIYKFKYFEEWHEMIFNHSVRHTFYFEYNNNQYLLVNEDNCQSHILVFRSFAFFPVTTAETGDISQTIAVRNGNKALYLVTNNKESGKSGRCPNDATSAWEFEEGKLELMFKMDEGIVLLQDSLITNTFYGLSRDGVTEFVIRPSLKSYRPIRRWIFFSENATFLPRGMQTGLSLYTEKKIIHLNRTNSVEEISDDDDLQTVLRGSLRETPNMFISKQASGTMITTTVGTRGSSETLLVVTERDDRGTDFINVFSNPVEGNLIQRIPAYKPSSILSLDFGQRQTLLVFLEDETKIQVYEYKGIEGFQWKNSAEVSGSQLFLMSIPIHSQAKTTKVIGVVEDNKIKLIQSVMVGARFSDEEKCHLSL
ncbi:unnamed protein product [Callosobruchus maculatus]|uniref:EF-hand domain-containing protein n=3 Tax=Callosobruchus maculatus TaxID=64391 RepID=A0A653CMV0_CALMS|nr:unnamed protein product [Callosobruchus maculatus]